VSKVFCKDCNHIIDEMPREEAKRRETVAKSVESASSASFDLVSSIHKSVSDETLFLPEQVLPLIKKIKTQEENHRIEPR